jgi:hypothetical protein
MDGAACAEFIISVEVSAKDFYILLLWDARFSLMRIKIAVGTFLYTPGDVYIEA